MTIPMFPLNTVVFPHTAMPLRVFEPRYQHLLDDVMAHDRAFGTVLIERGSEVGGGDTRFDIGAKVTVASIGRLPEKDHRQIIVVATGRVRVTEWLGDDPYPRAEVVDFPDEDQAVPSGLVSEVQGMVRKVLALASELGADTSGINTELSDDPTTASYQLAALTPVTALDSYHLLAAVGPRARLELCARMLEESARQINRQLGS